MTGNSIDILQPCQVPPMGYSQQLVNHIEQDRVVTSAVSIRPNPPVSRPRRNLFGAAERSDTEQIGRDLERDNRKRLERYTICDNRVSPPTNGESRLSSVADGATDDTTEANVNLIELELRAYKDRRRLLDCPARPACAAEQDKCDQLPSEQKEAASVVPTEKTPMRRIQLPRDLAVACTDRSKPYQRPMTDNCNQRKSKVTKGLARGVGSPGVASAKSLAATNTRNPVNSSEGQLIGGDLNAAVMISSDVVDAPPAVATAAAITTTKTTTTTTTTTTT